MKYITLEYDMNSPRDKAVSVPLDSDYGLAVKVYKNGALLQSSISVDQQTALSNYNGWQLFELSSGSQPCQKLIGIQAAEAISTHYGRTWTEHVENYTDEAEEFSMQFPFSDLLSGETLRLEASKTQLLAWLAGVQLDTENLVVSKDYDIPGETTYWTLNAETGKWVNTWDESETRDYIDVKTTDDIIDVNYILSAQQTAELRVVIEVDSSKEGKTADFKLVVKEKDMGRIDVKEQD